MTTLNLKPLIRSLFVEQHLINQNALFTQWSIKKIILFIILSGTAFGIFVFIKIAPLGGLLAFSLYVGVRCAQRTIELSKEHRNGLNKEARSTTQKE